MQDYHIYVHAGVGGGRPPTSPQAQQNQPQHCAAELAEERNVRQNRHRFTGARALGVVVVAASRINGYVGEYTENRLAQRRFATGLTVAGLVGGIAMNPVYGAIAAGMYFGDKALSYGIKVYKENLSADYLKQLSGGTVKTGR